MLRLAPPPASLPRGTFVARFGGVCEHSAWVAERAWDAGLGPETATPTGLAAALWAEVEAASDDERLALLRAHPDLAGRLALAGEVAEASRTEQAGAGLDRCTPEELAEFQALNVAYVARNGFPFIFAVRGRGRAEILAVFRARVGAAPEAERAEALEQVRRIVLLRLEAMADAATADRGGD